MSVHRLGADDDKLLAELGIPGDAILRGVYGGFEQADARVVAGGDRAAQPDGAPPGQRFNLVEGLLEPIQQ